MPGEKEKRGRVRETVCSEEKAGLSVGCQGRLIQTVKAEQRAQGTEVVSTGWAALQDPYRGSWRDPSGGK